MIIFIHFLNKSDRKKTAVEFLAQTVGQRLLDKTKDLGRVLALFQKMSLPEPCSLAARIIAPRRAFLDDYAQTLWMELDLLFADSKEQDLAGH